MIYLNMIHADDYVDNDITRVDEAECIIVTGEFLLWFISQIIMKLYITLLYSKNDKTFLK